MVILNAENVFLAFKSNCTISVKAGVLALYNTTYKNFHGSYLEVLFFCVQHSLNLR